MSKSFLFSARHLVVGATLVLGSTALPGLVAAQTLNIQQSSGRSIPVSCGAAEVQNTGTSFAPCWWYIYPNNHVNAEFDGYGYNVDGFCWDGARPGVSWRLRRAPVSSENPTRTKATITGQVCSDVLNVDGRKLGDQIDLPRGAKDPDIAVGYVVVKDEFNPGAEENKAWGMGNDYLIVGYHVEENGQNMARLNIYRIENPRYYDPSNPASVGAVLMPSDNDPSYSYDLGPGQNVNVDMGGNGEFAFTYLRTGTLAPEPIGPVMGGVGKLYTQAYGGSSGNGPAYHSPITKIKDAVISPFLLPQSLNNSREPDVSFASHYTHQGVVTFVWGKEKRQELDVAGIYMGDIFSLQPTGGIISVPVHLIYQEDAFAATHSTVYKPRIESYDLIMGSVHCKVAYKELQEALKGDCDLGGGIPALRMINVLQVVGSDITDPLTPDYPATQPLSASRTVAGTHVNRCMANDPTTNEEPAIASNAGGSGAALVYWTASNDGNGTLKDEDIVCHNITSAGTPYTSYGGYYQSASDHFRINNDNFEAGWPNSVPLPSVNGNQRAVSLAPDAKAAWYDDVANRIISHDIASNPSGYRTAPAAPAPVAEPKIPAMGTLNVIPNPAGKGALIHLALSPTETLTKLVITDLNTGAELAHLDQQQLLTRQGAEALDVPLQKLLPASLRQGVFAVKAFTTRTTYTTRLVYEPTEK